jgi:hypothetical protein
MKHCISVTLLLSVAFGDVCKLYFNDASSFCIDETAHCSAPHVPAITCEEAYAHVARRYGAVPLADGPGGLIRVPLIVESERPVVLVDAIDPRVELMVQGVTTTLKVVNAELAHWAPRVLYVPDRIGAVLRSLMADLRNLAILDEFFPSILKYFHSSETMTEFLFRVSTLADTALLMPNLRRNGFLNALIPFLHVTTEVIFMFPFRDLGTTLLEEIALLQTITQYHPMYADDPVWRLRLFNPNRIKWREYPVERFILPVETRDDEWCPNSAPMDTSVCFESVSGKLRTFTERMSLLATNAAGGMSVIAETGELLSDLLYLMDRTCQVPGYEEIYALISNRMRLLCSFQLGAICHRIPFSRFTQIRSRALLVRFLPDCVPEPDRISRVMVIKPITVTAENCPPVVINNGQDLIRYFSIESPVLLLPCIRHLWSVLPGVATMVNNLAVDPNVNVNPLTGSGIVRPETSMHDRRAIGRIVGYVLWNARHALGRFPLENVFEYIFFHSVEIRRGVYDIIPYGCLDNLRRNIYD